MEPRRASDDLRAAGVGRITACPTKAPRTRDAEAIDGGRLGAIRKVDDLVQAMGMNGISKSQVTGET